MDPDKPFVCEELCLARTVGCQTSLGHRFNAIEGKFEAANTAVVLQEKITNERINSILEKFKSMDVALNLREQVVDSRLHILNELRKDVITDREQFMRRDYYDLKHTEFGKRLEVIDASIAQINANDGPIAKILTRVSVLETRGIVLIAIIGAVFAILQVLLHIYGGK